MTAAAVVNLALFTVVLAVGIVVERWLGPDATLAALPWPLQPVVSAVAMSPIVFLGDQFGLGPVDGLVVAFALSAALWVGAPAALARVTDTEPTAARSC